MKQSRQTKTESDAAIKFGVLYLGDGEAGPVGSEMFVSNIEDGYTKAIRVISLSRQWVEHYFSAWGTIEKEKLNMEFTMRCEMRSGKLHWYAYRRMLGKLHKRYVGKSEDITEEKLADVARKLPG